MWRWISRVVPVLALATTLIVGLATVNHAATQHEDVLSAKRESVSELLSDGYRVVAYDMVADDEGRMILRKQYNLALCTVEESFADEESIKIESVCYRLR